MIKCKICNKKFKNFQSHGNHIRRKDHNITMKEYRIKFPILKEDIEYMISQNSKIIENTKCIIWTGCINSDGYGILLEQGVTKLLWESYYEPVPKGMVIRHKCDNPSCVNIQHLEIGTPYDNSQDMVKRGRSLKGDRNPMHRKEVKDKVSKTLTGRKNPDQSIRMKKNNPMRKTYICISPNNKRFIAEFLKEFCEENNLSYQHMQATANGYYKHHKNWKCEKLI